MLNKKTILMVLMLTLSTLFPYLAAQSLVGLSSSETIIHVEPVIPGCDESPCEVPVCDEFDVNINITGVEDLRYYEFTLSYNTTMLDVLEVSDDLFLPGPLNSGSHDKSKGEVYIEVIYPPGESKDGSGTLITIKFKSTGTLGQGRLELGDIKLRDSNLEEIENVEKKDGEYKIVVTWSKTEIIDEARALSLERYYPVCSDMLFYGDAFDIDANNFIMDLRGYTIMGQKGGGSARNGITISEYKRNVTIKNGHIRNFQTVIRIEKGCSNINIINVTIEESGLIGISIRESKDIMIENVEVRGPEHADNDEGVFIFRCYNVTLRNSIISDNGDGVVVQEAKNGEAANCSIINNTIEEHTGETSDGIVIDNSDGNIIESNTIRHNQRGIHLDENSVGNKIYHNNFIDNNVQAFDEGYNTWNLDYPYCGNYWNDYDCVDHCCGVSQNINQRDGIADNPYQIDPDNPNVTDEYPLKDPWGETYWVENVPYRNGTHPLAIHSSSSIILGNLDDFEKNPTQIDFTVSGTDTSGFCNIIIWSSLMNGAFYVLIDNVTIPSISTWNETQKTWTLIHFTYSNGTHNVQIVGEVPPALSPFDLNGDGKINIIDLAAIAQNYSP